MKKKLAVQALSLSIVLIILNGCSGSLRNEKETISMNDPKKKIAEEIKDETKHTCSCPHDENGADGDMLEVNQTDSGLMYITLHEAPENAPSPKKGHVVTVHYTGWLDDNGQIGTKFDSSVDRGQPFQFVIGVGQVIKGWDEGVMSMKVGEKRHLIIPAALGYGSRGAGGLIPGNATLHFEVELLGVN